MTLTELDYIDIMFSNLQLRNSQMSSRSNSIDSLSCM